MPINPDLQTVLNESSRRRRPYSPSQITQAATGRTVTAPTSAPSAVATTPAGTVAKVAGAPASQVAAANAAYHAQQALVQKYVFHQEKTALINQHVVFDQSGKAVGLNVSPAQIGQDLHKAAQKIRSTTLENSGLSQRQYEHVVARNAQGKTVAAHRVGKMIAKTGAPLARTWHKQGGIGESIAKPGGATQKQATITATGYPTAHQLKAPKPTLSTGQRLVQSITGVNPVSSQPGSILNTAINVAGIAASPLIAARAGRALEALPSALRGSGVAASAKAFAKNPRVALNAIPLAAKGKAVGVGASGLAAFEPAVQTLTTGAQREAQGFAQAPGKTLTTTARVALGLPAATLALPADAILAAREGSTAPLQALGKQTIDYYKQYATLVGPNEKKGIAVVQNQLGLLPAITAGLGLRTIGKFASRYRAPKVPAPGFGPGEGLRAASSGRKTGAQIASSTGAKARLMLAHEFGGPGIAHPRTKPLHILFGNLHSREIAKGVSEANAVPILGELGLYGKNVTTAQAKAELIRARDAKQKPTTPIPEALPHETRGLLGKGVELAPTVHDRKVLDALIAHPEVVHSKPLNEYLTRLHEVKTNRSIESHTELKGTPQTTVNPHHYVPTNLAFARHHGIPLPHETAPHELSHLPYTVKAGRDAAKVFRDRAAKLTRDAKKLRDRAANDPHPEALKAQAAAKEAQATEIRSVVNRYKDAKKLEQQAARIEAGHAQGDPAALRREAASLRKQAQAADAKAHAEFRQAVEAKSTAGGFAPRIHSRHLDLTRETDWSKAERTPWGRKARKSYHRTGVLLQEGRVNRAADTHLMSLIHERTSQHIREADRRLLTEHTAVIKPPGGGAPTRFVSEFDRANLDRSGGVPPGGQWVAVKEFGAAIQANSPLRSEYDAARTRASVTAPKGRREIYAYVNSKGLAEEHMAQKQGVGTAWRSIRKTGSLQQGLLIGDSPSWAANQLFATPLAMMISHPHPADWFQGARSAVDWWRKATPQERIALQAEYGAGGHGIADLNNVRNNLSPEAVRGAVKATDAALKTPVGRMVRGLLRAPVKAGGPLIRTVGAYESSLRMLQAFMDADTLAGVNFKGNPRLRTKVVRLGESVARLHDSVYKHLKQVEGMSNVERRRYELQHPEVINNIRQRIDDAIGNWTSLTMNQRKAAAVSVFYNFMRFSLRWFFVTGPRDHPARTALLANLSQSNADELQKIMKGTPSFFQTWGTIVVHPHGQATEGLNLARIAPGSNALLEAAASVGQGGSPLAAMTAPFQPLAGALVNAAAGQQYGQPSTHSFGNLLLQGAASLSPVTRPLRWDLVNRSDLSKLYAAVGGRYTGTDYLQGLEGAVNPLSSQNANIVPLSRLRATTNLDKLVARAYQPVVPKDQRPYLSKAEQAAADKAATDAAQAKAEIQKLELQYGIHTPASEKAFKQQGTRRRNYYYQTHDIFGNPIQKSSGGGGSFSPFSSGQSFSPFKSTGTFDPFGSSTPKPKAAAKPPPSRAYKNVLGSIPAIGNSRQVAPTVQAAAKQAGGRIPASVLAAQIQQESNFNQSANSGQAASETQFTPGTRSMILSKYGVDAYASAQDAIKAQALYMNDLAKQTGSVTGALNAYYGSSAPFTDASGTGSYASKVLAKAPQYTALDTGSVKSGPYVSPFAKSGSFTQSRTDEGVDYTGSGTINAIGKARYLGPGQAWGPSAGGGGTGYGVTYQLLKGPKKGKTVFTYEGIAPAGKPLSPGDIIHKGQPIASFVPGGSIETGYANASGAPLAQPTYTEGAVTKQGVAFQQFLSKVGAASPPGQSGISGGGTGVASSSPGATQLASSLGTSPAAVSAGQRINAAAQRARLSPTQLLAMVQRISRGQLPGLNKLPASLRAAASPTGTPTAAALAQLKRDYETLQKALRQPTTRA